MRACLLRWMLTFIHALHRMRSRITNKPLDLMYTRVHERAGITLSLQPRCLDLSGNISAMFDTAKLGPVVFIRPPANPTPPPSFNRIWPDLTSCEESGMPFSRKQTDWILRGSAALSHGLSRHTRRLGDFKRLRREKDAVFPHSACRGSSETASNNGHSGFE